MILSATQALLVPPLLLAPVHLSSTTDRTPRFLWNGRFEAAGYCLELWQDQTNDVLRFDDGFEVRDADPQTSIAPQVWFTPPSALALGTWHWRVCCVGADGTRSGWARERVVHLTAHDVDAVVFRQPLVHPYLHFGLNGVAALQQRIDTHTSLQAGYRRLLAAADVVAGLEIPDESYARSLPGQHERYSLVGGITWNRLAVLGMAWQLSRRSEYAEAARRILLQLAGFERWVGAPFLDPNVFDPPWHAALETAMTTYGMALGYDWIYDALSESERAAVRQAILDKGLKPLVFAWVNPESCGRIPRHQVPGGNWAMVCAGSAGVAALALLHEHPDAPFWVRQVRDRVRWWLHYEGGEYMVDWPWKSERPKPVIGPDDPNFDADGGYRESIGYMHYAMLFVNNFSDALRQVSDTNLFEHYPPALLDPIVASLYRYNDRGRDLERMADFGDSGAVPAFGEFYCCLMRNLGDGRAKALHDRILGEIPVTAKSLLWYDPTLARQPLAMPRAGHLFRGTGVVTMKTGSSRAGAHAALKTRENRGHHDLGAIYYYSGGETWITDSGVFDYASAIYQTFLSHSKAQNLVLVDGDNQVKTDGRIEAFVSGMDYAYTCGEFGAAYPDKLNTWTREMLLVAPDLLILADRLIAAQPHRYEWLLHPGVPYRVFPGEGVELVGQRDSLQVRMLWPEAFHVEEWEGYDRYIPRTYLALVPDETRADELFLAVLSPVTGEAGPTEIVRLSSPPGARAIRIRRADLELDVAMSDGGGPIDASFLICDGRFAAAAREHETGTLRLALVRGGTTLRVPDTNGAAPVSLLTAARPISCGVEWRRGGRLYGFDIPPGPACAVDLLCTRKERLRLDGRFVRPDRADGGTVRLLLEAGRHELQVAESETALDALVARRAEAAMVRTRPDAPVFVGARVRVSSAGGDVALGVIDGNDMTNWQSLPGLSLPQWVEIDFPEPRAVAQIRLCPTHGQDVVVEVRQWGDAPWRRVGLIENAPAEQPVVFAFERQTVHGVRVTITRTSGQDNVCGLSEVSWR